MSAVRVFCFLSVMLFLKSESESHSVVSDSLQPHGLYNPWNSLGQNTGVGSLSLLQGIFPTQRSNPGLSHCRWILYQLSHKGSPIYKVCLVLFTAYNSTKQLKIQRKPSFNCTSWTHRVLCLSLKFPTLNAEIKHL